MADIRYYVGVDGGGTACRARLYDHAGHALAEGRAGCANVQRGVNTAWTNIVAATEQALAAAELEPSVLAHTAVGLGLAGAVRECDRTSMLAHPHPFARARLLTDAHTAQLGAFAGGDGAILIIGTGSCGMIRHGNHFRSVGGLGFPASDHASGAWLGLLALRESLLALDGFRPATVLTEAVLAHFQRDPDAVVGWQRTATPRDYARFARLVCDHADGGDTLAQELIARELAEVETLIKGMLELGAECVCILGGLGERLSPAIGEPLRAHLVAARGDAMDGGLILAKDGSR